MMVVVWRPAARSRLMNSSMAHGWSFQSGHRGSVGFVAGGVAAGSIGCGGRHLVRV
jgi:hypothetical protein